MSVSRDEVSRACRNLWIGDQTLDRYFPRCAKCHKIFDLNHLRAKRAA